MNESTSESSLVPSGGKPSTANSTGSPNGRKTRTIIVARAIPDEPAKITPAAARGDGQSSAASDVVNQHHSRDARTGKLASYAALGGVEDVERFDQFLAEQRGQPSASELRAAATSPHHVAASMKRKTMSRVRLDGIDGIDGKLSDAGPADGDAAMRKSMQQELETDARKRRAAAVAQRKWLNSLPIHERVAQQRQQNALRKWRQMNRDWETFKSRAARQLGKAPQELVMSRAAAYREQREMYDALQKARPLNEKVGEDVWLVSLRDEGTRYVPVGNIFSGLFCPIRESTKLGPRVRRPLDYHIGEQDHNHDASRPLSKLEKRSLNLLARKKWRLRKQLEALQPHEVERSACSHLSVGTTDLFAWASGATKEPSVESDDEASVRTYSSVDEESRRHRLRSDASPISPKSVTKGESGNEFIGPCLRIAHVADDDEEPGFATGSNSSLCNNNPETCFPPIRLSFYSPVGEQGQRSLSMTNDGSTIVHYQWWRAPFEDESAELTAHLRGRRTRREMQELERFTTTSVSKLGGTLLPGETQPFVFTFESSKAGVFLEKWLLDADPQPRICFGLVPVDTDTSGPSVNLPVEVRLNCVAEDNFTPWRRRQKQLARMEQRESHFFVANLVDEILEGVRPTEAVLIDELTPLADVMKFYKQNYSDEFSDVYFSPDLVRDCYALYERAQGILRALLPIQAPVAEEENVNEEDGVDNSGTEGVEKSIEAAPVAPPEQINSVEDPGRGAEVQQETALSPTFPANLVGEWDWRLETLRGLCKMADEAQNVQIGRLTRQLESESEEVEEENDENEENEENDENDENEEDEADDVEVDDEEEDDENEETNAEQSKRLSPREVRKNEILARRKALEDEINTLQSNLQETFGMMQLSAYTAPYRTSRLEERLHERIGSLLGEIPIVCDIAKAMNVGNDLPALQAAKVEGVGKLIIRAIDEAVDGDQAHQALFEQERRRIQNMWLKDKSSYLSISRWMAKAPASTPLISTAEDTGVSPTAQNPAHVDNSGVLLMHVDLDLASWFSLVKAEAKEPGAPVDGASSKLELAWRFSQDLIQHAAFVPSTVAQAAESLEKVLNALSSTSSSVHTIVLVSELSRPPLTRQMQKLLRNAAKAELKAKALASNQTTGETDESKTQGGEEGEEAEITAMKYVLHHLSSQLSLRSVAQVVQRAIQKDVVFCCTVEDVQEQIDFSRKEFLVNSTVMFDGNGAGPPRNEVEVDSDLHAAKVTPRILLLEHLDAAGIDLITRASRKRELAKPVTPAPEHHKPVAGGKKAPAAASAKRKASTTGALTTPASAPPPETTPSSIHDPTNLEFAGKVLSEQGVMALRGQFMRLVSACVLDGIPSQPYEGVFAFESKTEDGYSPPSRFAGPTLYKELEMWSQTLQPTLSCTIRVDQPRVITAIVGGKSLESKLRLIDGLIEIAREIYFVGEVAMSFYRVLHTKQKAKLATHDIDSLKPAEEDEELEEDVDGANADEDGDLSKDGILEEETIESGNEKETGGHIRLGSAQSKGSWDLLVPAVEKLQQKASRKCVQLLLPTDWIVGDTPLEEQDPIAFAAIEEEDEEEEDEEEEEADEEEEDGGKKNRKRKASKIKSARQKPLLEPEHADVFERKRQGTYEGERAHVVLNEESSSKSVSPGAGWRTFNDVTARCLPNARVIEGKASVLASLWDSEGDEADDEGDDRVMHKPPPARFGYEWTFRALDVGPNAIEALAKLLRRENKTENQDLTANTSTLERALVINGVCGAVEFHEFCSATRKLLQILQGYSSDEVFITGNSTASWFRQLEIDQVNGTDQDKSDKKISSEDNTNGSASIGVPVAAPRMRKVVDDRVMRNARVLKNVVAAKPHPVLSSLVSSDSF